VPGDAGYQGVTGIGGEMVSICLSVLVQSCATYHAEFGLTLVGKPN